MPLLYRADWQLLKCNDPLHVVDAMKLNNGILSGLVAISASGPLVETEGAFVIGIFASAFYLLGVYLLKRWEFVLS